MKMRYTVGGCGAVGVALGLYALDQLRLDACLALQLRECLNLASLTGITLHLIPFLAMGLVVGVLLTPVFLTDADEEEHRLKWKLRDLRRLQTAQRSKEVDQQIAELRQRAGQNA